jgi:phage-related tail fiber protein
MGREAKVVYRSGKDRAEVRAHLDSAALELTGGKKLKIALADVRKATAEGDALKVETKTEKFELELGAKETAAWAKKILNPPTLADKLGVKAETKLLIVGERIKDIDEAAPSADHAATLTAAKAKAATVVILTLVPETAAKQIAAAAKVLPKATALWLVYTKGTKPNGDTIIALARKAGLKDTKVARISETHAALRFIAA